MARNWKKMSKEEEDKKRQETIDKVVETMNKGIYEYLDSDRFKTLLDTMSKFHDYKHEQHIVDSRTESSCHSPCRL